MIPWLGPEPVFPPVAQALSHPNGLLAAGGDLSPRRILSAYSEGIFPWFSLGEPILWWSPAPRMVLYPSRLRVSRSLAKALRRPDYEIRTDQAFFEVMEACSQPRAGQDGTWIVPEMVAAYCRLHQLGYAHSFETWIDGELAGGLYGVAIGRMFYGESMFARRTDASKLAFVHMVRHLATQGVEMIDCQMHTAHLESLGACLVPRDVFLATLKEKIRQPQPGQMWDYHYRHESS
ncbi:leucyl/phenylalanyl-tRNA--protein transferase [Chromobacterium subtsugae]|uniref:Leucyl/phenylalanyl-tRNA--protein transferase n=1 Tax=Chromobacterium subtsugae TaxID=251747 RepID=A0ABS7FGS8_9NEIS|nr:leucyl/phenylalanyl-tRNA--protein transferase [Chromobacterium subtsugae]KZE84630.1 leucyl/phenylalanyl-tRNA--protein transferase [Chromobacterium sp. F49]MBW7568163.1 leucyl/phenylalanyl-tRNA--protein transferase [Chromobacterium subtsugae]MBW8289274.1 leucyl/phenylalanyl-tRNA--protein transferase [Chromobacterium subtsugae]OBU87570.1 leucyl/phenylalanyl-tRNA--protein transferase [Chromobacterium subtsugae]